MNVVRGQRSVVSTRAFCGALGALLFVFCSSAQAQLANKIARIGFLSSISPSAITARRESLLQGLRELGYIEGKNLAIEYRYAEGNLSRLPALATELVRLKVDVIITGGPSVNRFAKEATATIPIVFAFDNDPVGNGFAVSLARPGGNITGLSTYYPEISGKQLELLKEIIPRLSRVTCLGSSTQPGNEQTLKETERAAGALGVKLQYNMDIQNRQQIESGFQAASKGHADAVLCAGEPDRYFQCKTIRRTSGKKSASDDIL